MKKCLDDMQIAMLVSGTGSAALRRTYSDHIRLCEPCRDILVAAVLAMRDLERAESVGDVATPQEIEAILGKILVQQEAETEVNGPSGIIPLVAFAEASELVPSLAAKSETSEKALQTLASPTRGIVVVFLRSTSSDQFVARVVRGTADRAGKLRIVFPDKGLSFPIQDDGSAELTSITRADFEPGKVQLQIDN